MWKKLILIFTFLVTTKAWAIIEDEPNSSDLEKSYQKLEELIHQNNLMKQEIEKQSQDIREIKAHILYIRRLVSDPWLEN